MEYRFLLNSVIIQRFSLTLTNLFIFSDPLQSLLTPGPPAPGVAPLPSPGGPLYTDHVRDRELRERNALVQSAFGMGGLFGLPPSNPTPPDLYPPGPNPLGLPPPPVTSPALFSSGLPRPDLSPRSLSSSRDLHPRLSPKVTMFAPHSSPSYLPSLSSMSTNNSNLSDKLRMGFGDSRGSAAANPENPGTIKRETGADMFLPPGPLTLSSSSSSSSTLVTKSNHSGMNNFSMVWRYIFIKGGIDCSLFDSRA